LWVNIEIFCRHNLLYSIMLRKVLILGTFALIYGNPDSNLEIAEVFVEARDARIEEKAKEALSFCKANGCSTDFCVLIDMKIHSGNHRMFVYDFKNKEVERSIAMDFLLIDSLMVGNKPSG